MKTQFDIVLNAIEARINKRQAFKTLNEDVICPAFLHGARIQIQSPKQIGKLCAGDTVMIEAPANLKADQVGFVDPFAWMQRKYGLMAEVLEYLTNQVDRKTIRIRTSSDFVAMDTNVALLVELSKRHNVTIEIAYAWGLNAESARFLLPTCPSEKRLLIAFKALKRAKLNVTKVNLS